MCNCIEIEKVIIDNTDVELDVKMQSIDDSEIATVEDINSITKGDVANG